MTFGGFDLLHLGHINLLREAKKRCEKLIVCVSTDDYIDEHKGIYPFLSLEDRIYLVKLTGYADIVDRQDVRGKKRLIEKYNPDALFVGDDWHKGTYDGEGYCRVVYLKHTDGISTSWYREKLRSN